jgi:hypothetical protein
MDQNRIGGVIHQLNKSGIGEHITKPTEESLENCEMYAKIAPLMFYPFRSLADLTIEVSYWKHFSQELQRNLYSRTQHFGIRDLIYYRI